MDASQNFDPYHKWLGIPPHEQPPNNYRLLRIEQFEGDPEVVEHAFNKETKGLEQHKQGEHVEHVEKLSDELSEAHRCLLNATEKAAYDATLRAKLDAEEETQRHAKEQAQQLAIQQAVQEAQSAITAEIEQLKTRIADSTAREQEALQTAAQLRQQIEQAGKGTF